MTKNKITRRGFAGWITGSVGALFAPRVALTEAMSPLHGDQPNDDAIAIGHTERENDMPAIAASPDGSFWATWLSFDGNQDSIAIRHFQDGDWKNIHWVPGARGDNWLPQVAVDAANRVWAVWSQQIDDRWDIYARRFDPNAQQWDEIVKISSGGISNINPRMWSDGKGRAAFVWQGFRNDSKGDTATSSIFLRILNDDTWLPEIRVTPEGHANEWDPSVVLDSKHTAWISYDSYRNGNYDVFLAQVSGDRVVHDAIPVAVSPDFEARSTIAVDSQDRVWVAWEAGLPNWGKDAGRILGNHSHGAPLGGFREPRTACYTNGSWCEPRTALSTVFHGFNTYQPYVFSDGLGSVWVVAMMRKTGAPKPSPHKLAYWEYWAKQPFGYWEYVLTHLDDTGWSEPMPLPHSKGRSSTRMGAALGARNEIFLAWPTDNRTEAYYHRPIHQQVYAQMQAAPSRSKPDLKPRTQAFNSIGGQPNSEAEDVQAMRNYRARSSTAEYRLLRGDLHRHTELSWDEGGANDGSLLDFYRYMLDVAAMDFGANTEHQGAAWPYWWWYSAKMTDMYHLPGSYTSLFAYERSASFPFGHRNVFFAKRSQAKVTPFYLQEGVSLYSLPLTSEGDEPVDETPQLVKNDTELLYEDVRRLGGIAIPHTPGTGMGTDWHAHDDEIEPVVEVFQGMRQSYEDVDAPYAPTRAEIAADAAKPETAGSPINQMLQRMFRLRPVGMVRNAWEKGFRLGLIASSDHHSTHISYAMVYTEDTTRQGILNAIRRRHTYGATANIILEMRMGEYFMGDSFATDQPLTMRIKARGTARIMTVDVLGDSEVLESFKPRDRIVELETKITLPDSRRHYYYVRLMQEDGMIAWSSPCFLNYRTDSP